MADEPATKSDFVALESRLEARLLERLERVETTLLNEFRKWVVPFGARTRVFEATSLGLTERMTMLEERMNDLEQR